jgi:hypothetical protein
MKQKNTPKIIKTPFFCGKAAKISSLTKNKNQISKIPLKAERGSKRNHICPQILNLRADVVLLLLLFLYFINIRAISFI